MQVARNDSFRVADYALLLEIVANLLAMANRYGVGAGIL